MSPPHDGSHARLAADEASPSSERPDPFPVESSAHRCTPSHVLELVYEVLGRPVGLDPCANDGSTVDARRFVQPPENGLEVDWTRYENGFVHPPSGQVEEPRWIQKAIQEAIRGWEGILLLPAKTGAPWFEALYQRAPCICFWGSPAMGVEGRLWLREEDMGATQFVYLGPRYEAFARVFARAGHLIYPRTDQALTTRISGRTMPCGARAEISPSDDLLRHAERRYYAGRHDPWTQATDGLPSDTRLCDLPASLREPIESLEVDELRLALSLLGREEPAVVPDATKPREARHPVPVTDPRQIGLPLFEADSRAYHNAAERVRFDQTIVGVLQAARKPLPRADIMAKCPCTENEYRGAIKRLKDAGLIDQVGNGKRSRYRATTTEDRTG